MSIKKCLSYRGKTCKEDKSCGYYMGLQKSEMGFHWDYRKVVEIKEGFRKKGHKVVWDSIGIIKKACWD